MLVLFATVLLRVVIIAAVAYLLLPPGPLCPQCQVEMLPIRNRLLERLVPAVQRRWCFQCGWNGVVRRGRSARRGTETRPPAISR